MQLHLTPYSITLTYVAYVKDTWSCCCIHVCPAQVIHLLQTPAWRHQCPMNREQAGGDSGFSIPNVHSVYTLSAPPPHTATQRLQTAAGTSEPQQHLHVSQPRDSWPPAPHDPCDLRH